MRRLKAFLLMEMVVALGLLFISGISMFTTLASSDRGYSQAIQARLALRLAVQTMESLRAGNLKATIGTQTLEALGEVVGKSSTTFTPKLVVTNNGTMLLVRSQVSWSEGRRTHLVELKTLVAP